MTKELRKEKDLLQRYLDIAGVIIVAIGANQKIKLLNRKGCEILGVSQRGAIGKNWFDAFIPKKNREETRAVFFKLISGKVAPVEYFENPILANGGKERLIAWHNNVLRDESGKIIATLSSGEDITERKIIEEERKQAELFYRTLFDESPDGVLIVDPQTERILEFNDKACKQLGYTRGEFKKLRITDFEAMEGPKDVKAHIEKIMQEGDAAFETLHRRKDGEIRNVFVRIKKINVLGRDLFLDVYQDITESKRTEEKLRESEIKFRLAFTNAQDAILWADTKTGILIDCNKAAERLFEKPKSQIIGKHQSTLHPAEAQKLCREDFKKQALGGGSSVELPIITKSGKIKTVTIASSVVKIKGEKIIQGVFRDITERKRSEEEIKHLATFPRLNPNPVIEVDENGKVTFANLAAIKAMEETGAARNISLFFPEDFTQILKAVRLGKKKEFNRELRIKGSFFLETLTIIPELKVVRIYARDITKRKEAEIALQESREDLKRAQAVAHTGSWRLDVWRNRLLWSDEAHRIFGIPKGRYLTYEVFLARVHPDDREYVDRSWKAALRGEPYDIEHRIVVAGKIKWIREKAELEFERRGKLRGGFGTCQDITERKRAEEALQRAHDELELKVAQRTAELAEANKHILYRNEILKLIGTKSSRKEFLEAVIEYLKGWSGCQCLGIRVLDAEGRIPYDAYTGFSREFWESENWLSVKEDQCACIRVIKGKPEPQDLPAMTKGGSFYSNNALKFEDSLSEHAKTRFRGVCVRSGFKSLAVIPIRNRNETYGAIHFADGKEGIMPLNKVEFLESLTGLIGEGIHKFNLEDKIHRDHAILDAFFKHAITPFVFLDPEFNFIRVNEAYARACRRDVSEFPGHNHFEFYPHEENERIFRQVVQTRAPFQSFAKPFSFPDHPEWGVTYWDWTLVPILDNKGEMEFLVFSLKDVTERKLAEEKLAATQKELESAKRLSDIGVLAATVAHELRNPLGVIRTAAYNIKRKAQNPSLDSHLVNIEKKILESDQIINNLLFYARLKMPHYESVRIYDILNECIKSARTRLSEHKAPVIKKFNSLRRDIIDADPLQITELVNNILNNAYDACLREDCKIEIRGEKDNKGNIEIVFKDNGIGMDEEHLKMAFEPFFSTKAKGTGLGLTVCNQIVNLHGGKICIDSKKGSGTSVTVTVPIKRSANAKENSDHR